MTSLGQCNWSHSGAVAPAVVVLELVRPCGHDRVFAPTCATCDREIPRVAPKPSPCSVCGAVNHPTRGATP